MPYYRAELGGNPPYEEGQGLDLTDSTLSLNAASTSEYGGAKVDGETIGINSQGQLFALQEQTITLSATTSSVAVGGIDTITATASGGGTISATSNDTDVATVSVSNGEITITGVSAGNATITVTASSVGLYGPAEATISVEVAEVHIYGAEWDGSSSPAWTRTDDAVGFADPNPYYSGMSGSPSSPFDNIMPWAGMQIVEDSNAGTLVEIPKFYYKLDQVNSNGLKIQISDNQFDGSVCSPAHMDRGDGVGERDYVYVGRYHCSYLFRSNLTDYPKHDVTRSSARSGIHNLGANIWQMDFATRFTIWLLYLVEFAHWNSQEKIGYGCGNNSSLQMMGYTDSMPYHTGTTQSSRTTYGLGTQYRYIEGSWDNVYDYIDGCYYNSNGLNVILNPTNFSDSSGGVAIGTPSRGYPSKFTKTDVSGTFPMFIPAEANGSQSTYSCDLWSFYTSDPCLYAGGDYYRDPSRGLFYVHCTSTSTTSASIGSRLMVLPPSRLSPPTN